MKKSIATTWGSPWNSIKTRIAIKYLIMWKEQPLMQQLKKILELELDGLSYQTAKQVLMMRIL